MYHLSDPFDYRILGNPIDGWLEALGLLAGAIVLLYLVRRLATRLLLRSPNPTTETLGVALLRRTRFFFVFFVALHPALQVLTLPPRWEARAEKLIVVAIALQCVLWGNTLVNVAMARYARHHDAGESATTVSALGYLGRLLLFLLVLLVALENLGINITALVTGLGVSGIALALAVQNILGDLFGALSIVLDKPFVVGDAIAVDQYDGTVEHIGLKTTRIRATSGEQLIFSNADLLKSRIRNFKRMETRRVSFATTIAYAAGPADAARVPTLLREIVAAQPGVRFDRAHLRRLADTGPEYETVYFVTTADYTVFMDAQQAINLAILQRFADEGIPLTAPLRTVQLQGAPAAGPAAAPIATGPARGAAARDVVPGP